VVAVQNREKIFGRARKVAGANLELLDQFMSDHADHFGWVRPVGGMTAFPWLASDRDARGFCESLAGQGVLFAPGDCFRMPSHFRLGFGASGERFPEALERLSDFLKHYPAQSAKA
jgi:DNA-binding transcriptional MocR family regulator